MTHIRPDGTVVIADEQPQQCDDCGTVAEIRPYGPDGRCICLECAEKDPEGTFYRMMRRFGFDDETIRHTWAQKPWGEQ